jgi:hypothetical protein
MKKNKEVLSPAEALARRDDLAKDLVKFRVSLDTASIASGKNPAQLRRELRRVSRVAAVNYSKK